MEKLYHGSKYSGIKKLEPKHSTHGTFVYATPSRELAIIFSSRCGDDLTYSLFRESNNEPWNIVERIPHAFATMFSNSSSLYTLNDTTFKDIHTGFYEVVSEVPVDVLKEEKISNVYEEIKKLESLGKVKLYHYPDRPKSIPVDDSDLLLKEINHCKRSNTKISKNTFKRLVYLHPNLISLVNSTLSSLDLDVYKEADLLDIFDEFLIKQILDISHEQYLTSAFLSLSKYPKFTKILQEKMLLVSKDKNEKISYIFDFILRRFQSISIPDILKIRDEYLNDSRSFLEISNEILELIYKLLMSEEMDFNKKIL